VKLYKELNKSIIDMPGRIRTIGKGKMRRGPDRRSEDFRERQRLRSREQMAPLPVKKQATPIPTKSFREIPEINPVDLSNYDFSRIINGVISPGKGLEKAVHCFMINMLAGYSNIYEPGKSYSRREKDYTREQLKVFAESLSALEVSFSDERRSVGRFRNKDRYSTRDLQEKGNYHVVYVRAPSSVLPGDGIEYSAEDIAERIVEMKYKDVFEELESLGDETAEEFRREGVDIDEDTDPESIVDILKEYRDAHPRRMSNKACRYVELMVQMNQAIKDELENLPDEKEMITRLSQHIAPNGVLILESTEVKDIPGLRLVGSYDDVSLYQKE
jgi:hypothetical protein